MRKNISPWLHQMDKERESLPLTQDIESDIVIIGAGIAGVSTAFEILEKTPRSVTLLEASRLAHGATGHNAGQIVGHFERGLKSLSEEFGIELAVRGQRAIESGWDTLESIYATAGLDIPFFSFFGHTGLTSVAQVLVRLESNRIRVSGGLDPEHLRIIDDPTTLSQIPAKYASLYTAVPAAEINAALETDRTDFIAVLSYRKGCINSALFCQEVVRYLSTKYPDRFALYEHTPVQKVVLRSDSALIDASTHTVAAKRVILCTNGFETLRIYNETGLDIDARYHHLLEGKRGYMSGYLEQPNKSPTAISYFLDPGSDPDVSYYYLTRRPYEYEKGTQHNLICIGGPDEPVDETRPYSRDEEYPDHYAEEIDDFIKSTYDTRPNVTIDYRFTWHGLMGYTKNFVRMVGPEPKNPVLLYNLGCNGIGILPSLYGATKIRRHILGEDVEKSIFDVPEVLRLPEPLIGRLVVRFFRWLRKD